MKNSKNRNPFFLIILSTLLLVFLKTTCQEEVGEYLDNLGRTLAKKLSHPETGSDTLIRDLFDYYNHLEEIHENITSGNELQVKEGYDLVQEIVESGGPPHLKIEVDFDELLFKVFKNDRDVQSIHDVLKDNRKMWEKVKALYEKHAHI